MPRREAWGPLQVLPDSNYLRMFVGGLCHLIRDEFTEAMRWLERGILRNEENLPMNRDMQLIIDEIRARPNAPSDADEPLSSAHLLLQQSALKGTKH